MQRDFQNHLVNTISPISEGLENQLKSLKESQRALISSLGLLDSKLEKYKELTKMNQVLDGLEFEIIDSQKRLLRVQSVLKTVNERMARLQVYVDNVNSNNNNNNNNK